MIKIPLIVPNKGRKSTCIGINAKVINSNILNGCTLNSFLLKREIPKIRKIAMFSILVQISKKLFKVRIRPKTVQIIDTKITKLIHKPE